MHQHRRRKKRSSYGVRTVEISRGKNGFGFTISGQAPCILSCIITGSPAEKAGLRPGDFLIAVNGQNVSKAPHDDVVRLIGNSQGILKLQIAENYYSDSSEEEFISVVKLRPKYPNKVRSRQNQASVSRAEKVVQDLQTGALFVDHIHGCNIEVPLKQRDAKGQPISVAGSSGTSNVLLDSILQQRIKDVSSGHSLQNDSSQPNNVISSVSSPTKNKQICWKKKEANIIKSRSHPEHLNTSSNSAEIFHSIFTEQDLNNILYPAIFSSQNNDDSKSAQEQAVLKAVVGYLGTIEMPKENQLPNSRLQTIRNCIRRLRIEKKVHTLVLMSVFPESIILINPQGITLAEFSADKITFSGVYSDDKKFFGLVTNHGISSDELSEGSQEDPSSVSSSCHVFMVDPKLTPHHQHMKRAKAFHITCTSDPVTNKCKEFPESADSILQAVVGLYRSKLGLNNEVVHGFEFHINMSPQQSNTSSNSSNSDSGIGFRDEGNASDRVCVVDVDNYHQYSTNSLDRQAFATLGFGSLDSPMRSFSLSQDNPQINSITPSHSQLSDPKSSSNKSPAGQFDRLTVRAMPDPVGFECNCNSYHEHMEQSSSNRNNFPNSVHMKSEFSGCAKNNPCLNNFSSSSSENILNDTVKADVMKNNSSSETQMNKLSPKVYGLNFPLKSVEDVGLCRSSADSVGWECTSCSTEDLQSQSRHLMLQETQDTTEQEEDGSQDVHPPTQEEDSESEVSGHVQSQKHCQWIELRHLQPSGTSPVVVNFILPTHFLIAHPSMFQTAEDGGVLSIESASVIAHAKVDHNLEVTRKSARTSSLRRHLGRKRSLLRSTHEAGTVSDGELASGKVSTSSSMLALDRMSDISHRSSCASERPVDVGRVGSWAAGFNVLLEDPAGLHTFSEFLKKEFSQENITFWIACERYRQLNDRTMMIQMAKEIYSKHLCIGALEPVNVDSHARQVAQEGLESPTPELFLPAQKQIFNLMKFDCYQRFLKSAMFKDCMLREMKGQPLLYQGQLQETVILKDDKQKLSGELKKRKSLIPWHKLSKTKSSESKSAGSRLWDRHCEIRKSLKIKKKEMQKLDDTSSTQSDMTDSRSSLTSSENGVGMIYKNVSSRESLNSAELTLFPSHCGSDGFYCRVILPDLSTTVVKTQKGETVGEMLLKLLERRNLTYNAVEAFVVGSLQPLDHGTDVTTLSCKEIRVEQVILFCLELPNRKTIGVKAKSNKVCGDILKPVLHKYGYKVDQVTLILASSQKPVNINSPITSIDNQRIVIELNNSFTVSAERDKMRFDKIDSRSIHSFPDLEELTSQIFDDLLKSRPEFHLDSHGVLDIEKKSVLRKDISSKAHLFHYSQSHPDIERIALKCKTPTIKEKVNSSCAQCAKQQCNVDSKYEISIKDKSHGKENCPLVNKGDIKLNLSSSNIDIDYGLATAFQNIEHRFTSDLVYPGSHLSENFSPRTFYSSSDFEETNSEKFLQNLGVVPSVVGTFKSKHIPWSSSPKPSSDPLVHRPFRLPPRLKSLELQDSLLSSVNRSSPSPIMDSTLINNDSFELDLDVDVTLRAHSDESLSPSRVGFAGETANQDDSSLKREISKETTYTRMSFQRLSCEPPPVPPKATARGPPPRPPSRQLGHTNPAFCLSSEGEVSEGDENLETSVNADLVSLQVKDNYLDLGKDGEFNISFV